MLWVWERIKEQLTGFTKTTHLKLKITILPIQNTTANDNSRFNSITNEGIVQCDYDFGIRGDCGKSTNPKTQI